MRQNATLRHQIPYLTSDLRPIVSVGGNGSDVEVELEAGSRNAGSNYFLWEQKQKRICTSPSRMIITIMVHHLLSLIM